MQAVANLSQNVLRVRTANGGLANALRRSQRIMTAGRLQLQQTQSAEAIAAGILITADLLAF